MGPGGRRGAGEDAMRPSPESDMIPEQVTVVMPAEDAGKTRVRIELGGEFVDARQYWTYEFGAQRRGQAWICN